MSTFYAPGCKEEKAHICNYCEVDDGRHTLYWVNNDFDLCYECVKKLYQEYIYKPLSNNKPVIVISRTVITEELRNKIYQRDNYRCCHCGSIEKLCIDHIIPFSKGGITKESNLQTLCKHCNSKKGVK